ncbi:MAG TPA: helix-turn-helix domain-containing protein [Dehalococcoidales bacterium]|nr:helix-turn-helix domain-containing protein [Dehalococcoidales bacterium]
MDERTLTAQEVADIYKIAPHSVYYWVRKGLPFQEERVIGRKLRKVFKMSEVESFLKLGIKKTPYGER